MKIVVSGANGYIGAEVIKELCSTPHEVIALDFANTNLPAQVAFLPYNILQSTPNTYTELGKPDVFLHLAWKDGFVHNSPVHMEMLSAHAQLIRHLLEGGLKHLAIMGTMHEIGYHEGAIDENTPCNPISQYGIAKNALRQSSKMLAQQHGATWQWLRAFYIYGNDINAKSIFGKLLRAHKVGQTTFPFTSGKNKYDFISVSDLAKQIVSCICQNKINGVINCCSGKPVSLAEQVEWFIKHNHLNLRLEYGTFPDREYDSPCIYGDNTKIKQIINNNL